MLKLLIISLFTTISFSAELPSVQALSGGAIDASNAQAIVDDQFQPQMTITAEDFNAKFQALKVLIDNIPSGSGGSVSYSFDPNEFELLHLDGPTAFPSIFGANVVYDSFSSQSQTFGVYTDKGYGVSSPINLASDLGNVNNFDLVIYNNSNGGRCFLRADRQNNGGIRAGVQIQRNGVSNGITQSDCLKAASYIYRINEADVQSIPFTPTYQLSNIDFTIYLPIGKEFGTSIYDNTASFQALGGSISLGTYKQQHHPSVININDSISIVNDVNDLSSTPLTSNFTVILVNAGNFPYDVGGIKGLSYTGVNDKCNINFTTPSGSNALTFESFNFYDGDNRSALGELFCETLAKDLGLNNTYNNTTTSTIWYY